MSRKTFILDTNVLLHDPQALENFPGHDVLLPFPVLEELDKKSRFSDELGNNSRFVLRFISKLEGDLFEGVTLGDDTRFSLMKRHDVKLDGFHLPLDSPRHRILHAAFAQKKKTKNLTLVSKDFVLRTLAESLGIHAEKYRSLTNSYENMYQGLRRMELEKKDLDHFLAKGSLELPGETFYPNEYAILSCPENSSVTTKFNPKTNRLEPLPHLRKNTWGLRPLNDEQACAIDLLLRDDIKLVSLIGQAGTGKTLLALTCGLKKVFEEDVHKKILVSRPIMPLGKDIGFLPGSKEDKVYHWMQPIYDNLEYLCEHTAGEEGGKEKKAWVLDSEKIEMEAVTYIRGRSLANTYIIIDEAQNLTPHEVKTIISRAGKGTKVILTGDPTQIDNPFLDKDSNALTYIVGKFKPYEIYGHVFLQKTERSALAALAADVL